MSEVSSSAPWPQLRRSLVAILRGIKPEEAEPVVATLIEAGFEAIEIPLNSPDAFRSIASAVRLAGPEHYIGAGTVLTPEQVDRLAETAGASSYRPMSIRWSSSVPPPTAW